MDEWLPRRSKYLEEILGHDALLNDGMCSHCNAQEGRWRCLDCIGHQGECRECCRRSHQRLPFHRIEYWTGTYYKADWLCNLGVVVDLGHGGQCCPLKSNSSQNVTNTADAPLSSATSGRDVLDIYRSPSGTQDDPIDATRLTIVDQNGIHAVWVRFCICDSNEDEYQILAVGLYPVTFRQIRSAFTFRVLDDFRLENLECKTSAYQYYNKLRRATSPLFPTAAPVCRRSLSSRDCTNPYAGPVP
jgi:CxC2 like cysteine cluster associated with KDZ transposases